MVTWAGGIPAIATSRIISSPTRVAMRSSGLRKTRATRSSRGLRRKEAYATSGTRPIVRFFGGSSLSADLCNAPDMIAHAYAQGVPMGGRFSGGSAAAPPRFLVSALKDPGIPGHPGTDLQRIQVIKGWLDADGETHEAVYDVAGDVDNGAGIDEETCAPTGTGAQSLCAVWEDPEFDSSQAAFYYVRVLENPTCRWSTLQCQAAGVESVRGRLRGAGDRGHGPRAGPGRRGRHLREVLLTRRRAAPSTRRSSKSAPGRRRSGTRSPGRRRRSLSAGFELRPVVFLGLYEGRLPALRARAVVGVELNGDR